VSDESAVHRDYLGRHAMRLLVGETRRILTAGAGDDSVS
jgi:hypothetical protein